jgi:predicted DsbA family dithiol-disulfide isomerase
MIEAAGFSYAPPPQIPRSRKALELTEFARDEGLHEPVHDRLMRGYWSEGADIGDEEILLGLAAEAGLERGAAAAAVRDGSYSAQVDASTAEAQRHGIQAIPAFVLGGRLLLLGAQPHETFEQAVEQLAVA